MKKRIILNLRRKKSWLICRGRKLKSDLKTVTILMMITKGKFYLPRFSITTDDSRRKKTDQNGSTNQQW